jgi:predicted DNA binding CopG/RHH family protein
MDGHARKSADKHDVSQSGAEQVCQVEPRYHLLGSTDDRQQTTDVLPESLLERIKIEANRRDMPYQSLIKAWLMEDVSANRRT